MLCEEVHYAPTRLRLLEAEGLARQNGVQLACTICTCRSTKSWLAAWRLASLVPVNLIQENFGS